MVGDGVKTLGKMLQCKSLNPFGTSNGDKILQECLLDNFDMLANFETHLMSCDGVGALTMALFAYMGHIGEVRQGRVLTHHSTFDGNKNFAIISKKKILKNFQSFMPIQCLVMR